MANSFFWNDCELLQMGLVVWTAQDCLFSVENLLSIKMIRVQLVAIFMMARFVRKRILFLLNAIFWQAKRFYPRQLWGYSIIFGCCLPWLNLLFKSSLKEKKIIPKNIWVCLIWCSLGPSLFLVVNLNIAIMAPKTH